MPDVHNGQLYVRSHQDRMDVGFPKDKSWTADVARDPRVRIKIGDKLYQATLVLVADRSQAMAILGRAPETLQKEPDGREQVVGYDHVFRVFQRDIPEYGGNQQSPSSAGLVPENNGCKAVSAEDTSIELHNSNNSKGGPPRS
jgi:hypothetical protein